VGFISLAELNLYFVAMVGLSILEEKIKSASPGLEALLVLEHHIAQPKNLRMLRNAILHPALGELRMVLERQLGEGLVNSTSGISASADVSVVEQRAGPVHCLCQA